MGSTIEINHTLKISVDRGFPKDLTLEQHTADPESSRQFLRKEYEFWNPDERHYPSGTQGTRVLLVEEMPDGRWLHWGQALVVSQTIGGGQTRGVYTITKIYSPEFQRTMTVEHSPRDKSYFPDPSTSIR